MTFSGCPYCGTAIDKIVEECPYCKKELPEAIKNFLIEELVKGKAEYKKKERLELEEDSKGISWFKREYTKARLMSESRNLLIFIGIIQTAFGVFLASSEHSYMSFDWKLTVVVYCALGSIYVLIGFLKFYWLRFIAILFWILDLIYTNWVPFGFKRHGSLSLFFIFMGLVFLYKMVVYKDNVDPAESLESTGNQV
jgi:hypothetical protein